MSVAERVLKISHPVVEFVLVLPLSIIGAALSYRLFEAPFLKRKAAFGGGSCRRFIETPLEFCAKTVALL